MHGKAHAPQKYVPFGALSYFYFMSTHRQVFRSLRAHARLRAVLGSVPTRFVHVNTRRQRLSLVVDGYVNARYDVSTARAGCGSRPGSLRTPTGVHRIAQRIGAGAPPGTVFRSRKATRARWNGDSHAGDLILSRILWLDGLEPGHNRDGGVDTRQRYIYVHGTNHERLLGTRASHGCVRMSNRDVIALFDQVKRGTIVIID
jgi:lipoprotein-anchoring transpeptidase ErfK/SrfK